MQRQLFDGEIKFDVCDFTPKTGITDSIHIKQGFIPIEKESNSPSDVALAELIVPDGKSVPIAMKMFFRLSEQSRL